MILPGIVIQAVVLTLVIAVLMNILYQLKIIKVTEKFRTVMLVLIASIFGLYILTFILSFFSIQIPYIHSTGLVGIGFSIFVVIIASLTFLLDFDLIDRFIGKKVHRDYEWYGAFILLVTLVWLYVEVLRLLYKIRSND